MENEQNRLLMRARRLTCCTRDRAMSTLPPAERSSHRIVRRFVALCERAAVAPTVGRFLATCPRATARQRVDVMLVDLARRLSRDQSVRVEEYLSHDAEIAGNHDLSLELIVAEFDLRTQLGRTPEVDEYVARFGRLEQPLRTILAERSDGERLPSYPTFVRHVLEDGLTPGTVWGGRLGNSTGFGGASPATLPTRPVSDGLLASCPPFSLLPEPVVRLIESSMQVRHFDVGEHLMRQDEPAASLMVLCDGEVEINTSDDAGQQRVLARTSQVQVLGEMALLTNRPRSANVAALTPVRALVLPAEQFHELAGRYPEISEVLTLLLAERLGVPGRDDVLAGKTLDEYRICSRLGRGGMAVVYEARHVESDRHVALKMMSHRLVYDQEALDQFQTEADIIQSFDHENIVKLYGRFAAFRTYFIVMEFAEGVSLRDHIAQHGPLPADEFKRAFAQIARALRYAHGAGVIHRDVKPANIMLAPGGAIKLMDFGLATPALGSSTGYGKVVGTPRYMAPEQLIGGRLTTAADLFSLGCVGYEMLTGEPLTVEYDVIELLRLHSTWEVPDMKRLRPHLPVEVCHVIEQCLPYDPAERRLDVNLVSQWT